MRLRFFICFFMLALLSPTLVVAETMHVELPQKVKPFFWMKNNWQPQGIFVDYLNEILGKEMGIELKYEACPWARCQELVRTGEKDALFTIPTPARREYTLISKLPLFSSGFYCHIGVDSPYYDKLLTAKSLDDLKRFPSLRYVHLRGSGWHEVNLKGEFTIEVSKVAEIWELLKQNRADVYLQQKELVMQEMNNPRVREAIKVLPNPVAFTDWHLCIGKKSPFADRMPQIDRLLERMKKDGSLDALKKTVFSKYQ
ncbi:transporter substrate-binding domain-containing protein [Pseudodesulfovibrio sp.]|nr:transporter substrate-binding domain-containing protein [Pseudodesulfovibrio sp.]